MVGLIHSHWDWLLASVPTGLQMLPAGAVRWSMHVETVLVDLFYTTLHHYRLKY